MAKNIKCKYCKSENNKYNKLCKACGKSLYKEISFKNAMIVTLILDIFFAFIYIIGIFLFIKSSRSEDFNIYSRMLPAANSTAYFLVIGFFIFMAFIKILFVVNYFFIKNKKLYILRRANMFIESITMFPLQLILALYFYDTASNTEKQNIGESK